MRQYKVTSCRQIFTTILALDVNLWWAEREHVEAINQMITSLNHELERKCM